jgi:hypothetical protein
VHREEEGGGRTEKLLLVVEELFAGLGSVFDVLSWATLGQRGDQRGVRSYILSTMASTGQASWQNYIIQSM